MRSRILPALAATAVAGLTLAAAGLTPAAAAPGSNADWEYKIKPVQVQSSIHATSPAAFPTPAQCVATYGLACNTPDTIRAAYDIPATIDGKPAGTGTTIAIVDAYGSPTIQQDLDTFSQAMGIPSTTVHVSYPTGKVVWTGSDQQNGWAGETSLDVEWAHAIAPGAKIELVIGSNPRGNVINNAIKYAIGLKPDTLSMSFSSFEGSVRGISGNNIQYKQARKMFASAAASGVTSFASSGDWGSDNGLGFSNFDYPASDPNVVAVGGTTLYKNISSTHPAETTWDDYTDCPFGCTAGVFGATGGAPSLLTSKQGSDVAYNASVYTAVLVYESFDPANAGFYFYGGTSSGSPQWAAATADLVQAAGHRLGNIRGSLSDWAAAGALYDVTAGDDKTPTYDGGYAAGPGWDAPTGYGTPDVGKLISLVS